jgi:glucosyl-dolichyl phosphate glucuronosyltransferase
LNSPFISIVICTYNRCEILQGCLRSLVEQTAPPNTYEIIIVNNNSSDNTQQFAEQFGKDHQNARVVFEARQGLSHARNRGWHEAKSEWIAYVDDDCRVPSEWLYIASMVIETCSPAVFGGPYYPFFDTLRPAWYKEEYGSHVQDTIARPLKTGEYLDGGNIFFRRALLKNLGGFDTRLGMSGDHLGYGEETELQIRIRREMPQAIIYYEPTLRVYHKVPAYKMDLTWLLKHHVRSGMSSAWMYTNDKPLSLPKLMRSVLATLYFFIGDCMRFLMFRDRMRYPHVQNFLIESIFPHIRFLSMLSTQLRAIFRQDGKTKGA